MTQPNYHGILIDKEFSDEKYPEQFKIFAKKVDGAWTLFGIEVENEDLDKVTKELQENLKVGTWYAHFYNDEELIVVFKEKVFKVTPHISSWNEIISYGETLKIPADQLTFWPNRFQDERHYFN